MANGACIPLSCPGGKLVSHEIRISNEAIMSQCWNAHLQLVVKCCHPEGRGGRLKPLQAQTLFCRLLRQLLLHSAGHETVRHSDEHGKVFMKPAKTANARVAL